MTSAALFHGTAPSSVGAPAVFQPLPTSNKTGKTCSVVKKPQQRSKTAMVLSFLRALFLDMPLAILFALLLTVYILHNIHDTIFVPFLQAAARSDEDLEEEFTYYDRSCTAMDLTTSTPSDLILSHSTTPSEAVDTFMTHGGVVFPQILPPDTVTKLRQHVVQRNEDLTELEEIVLSQGENRKSFAFDASEDPIVSLAIKQVASHPLLKPFLQELLGDEDPAVSEITAITSYYGCPDQAWHQDVKADGSPLKFARTYTHSHSLFIALQDTSAAMGATSFCPGTHYCANDGMSQVCQEYGFAISEASPHKVWHSGDAALLSQHVWHRGAKHVEPDAPERILFVMTFLARPNLTRDRRQLSRGTYFHMRWNMWGHTFKDLLDAGYIMAKPFSVLRCLGLWKPANRNWGYDLMTSGLLRCANNQMGMTYEELNVFVKTVMSKLRIPKWLQGPVTEEHDAWQIYLRETLNKMLAFVVELNLFVLGPYLLLVIMTAAVRRKMSVLTGSLYRLFVTHGILLLVGYHLLTHVYRSPFATDLRSKRLLMRAFPAKDESVSKDMAILAGLLTLPERNDVLVGSRFDARFLGAFDRWLDYHPGNKLFRATVADNADYYRDYSGLPHTFRQEIVTRVESATTRRGRFLSQDYQTGFWTIMSNTESQRHVRQSLLTAVSGLLNDLDQEISYMLAEYRFGLIRGTALAKLSQEYLLHWRSDLLFPRAMVVESSVPWGIVASSDPVFTAESSLDLSAMNAQSNYTPLATNNKRWSDIPSPPTPPFEIGDMVMEMEQDMNGFTWYRGSIIKIEENDDLIISLEEGTTVRVPHSVVRPAEPLEEGTRIRVKFDDGWYDGTVLFVYPNQDVAVEYDDGDYDQALPFWRYQIIVE